MLSSSSWWYKLHLEDALQDLYKDAQQGAPDNALKGAFQVGLQLHLFMKLSIDKSVQHDSIKDETEEKLYAVLEGKPKISF